MADRVEDIAKLRTVILDVCEAASQLHGTLLDAADSQRESPLQSDGTIKEFRALRPEWAERVDAKWSWWRAAFACVPEALTKAADLLDPDDGPPGARWVVQIEVDLRELKRCLSSTGIDLFKRGISNWPVHGLLAQIVASLTVHAERLVAVESVLRFCGGEQEVEPLTQRTISVLDRLCKAYPKWLKNSEIPGDAKSAREALRALEARKLVELDKDTSNRIRRSHATQKGLLALPVLQKQG